MNQIRKLLVEAANQMEAKSNKIINIWTETKNTIKRIGIEETNNRRRQIQKTERVLRSRLGKKAKIFQDMKTHRQEIEKLMKKLNEKSRIKIKRSQKTAKTRYLKEGQKNMK